MLGIFKINDPYRLIIVLIFLVAVQIPYFISAPILTLPEILWHTIGEKLAGGHTMYVDVYYPSGIFSSTLYWIMAGLFHNSYFLPRFVALILIFIQAAIFNFIMLNYKAYNQNSYVPSILYVLLMIAIPGFNVLSPQLMGMVFILLSVDLTFQHIEGRKKLDWVVLRIGFYLGIATLFYPLYYLILISTFISFVLFTNTIFRRYFLLLIGFAFPFLLVWLKYFWFNQHHDLYLNLRYLLFPENIFHLLTLKTIAGIMIIPIIFFLFSFYKVAQTSAFINYQVRLQNFMLLMLLAGLVIVFMDYTRASVAVIVFVPGLAFYISHYFLLIRKNFKAELLFLIFLIAILVQNYGLSFGKIHEENWLNIAAQQYTLPAGSKPYEGKQILVLGRHEGEYYHNRLSTPYLSWMISRHQFARLDLYRTVIKVFDNFREDMPEIIIDKENCMPELFKRIPYLEDHYYPEGGGVYTRLQVP